MAEFYMGYKQCPIFLEKGSFRLTSPFDPNGLKGRKHGGTDGTRDGATATYICPKEMDGAKVTEILSTIKGTENSSGNYVTLHKTIEGKLIALRIKHMAYGSIPLKLGQIVHAGDVLGYMGNTGHSTAAHAHVELIYPGEWVDAYPWLSGQTDMLGNPLQGDDDMGYPILGEKEFINTDTHPADRVTKLQQILKYKYGYDLPINGTWTDELQKAIRDYQTENGLGADGRVGPATIESLNRDLYAEIKELRADNAKSKQAEQNYLKEMARIQLEMGKLAEERNGAINGLKGIKSAIDILKSI